MIAREIKGRMEPVGTIDLDKDGFSFETSDAKLSRLLGRVRKNGLQVIGPPGSEGPGIHAVNVIQKKITEDTTALLEHELLVNEYYWWEEI